MPNSSLNQHPIFFFHGGPKSQHKLCLIKFVLLRKTNICTTEPPVQINSSSKSGVHADRFLRSAAVLFLCSIQGVTFSPGDTLSIVTEQPAGSQKSDSHKPRLILPLYSA